MANGCNVLSKIDHFCRERLKTERLNVCTKRNLKP